MVHVGTINKNTSTYNCDRQFSFSSSRTSVARCIMAELEREHISVIQVNDTEKMLYTMVNSKTEITQYILNQQECDFNGYIKKPISGYLVQLPVKPDAVPIYRKAYTIPFHLRAAVKLELNKLQAHGVITPIDSSDWATPLAAVKNNNIRLC